jgi:microcystin-dependent protein
MDAYVGEIRAVGFNFAPRNWALCNGALLPISRNTALFSLIGTYYGGDGKTTFALPDLRSRAIVGVGQGPGLSAYSVGEMTGSENHTLLLPELPPHVHTLNGSLVTHSGIASTGSPAGAYPADTNDNQYAEDAGTGTMNPAAVKGTAMPVGGNQPHNNLMPYTAVSYIIALQGIFPPRS